MRTLSRVSDALNAHYFVGMGNEIALLSLPKLSLYFSLSSSFGRKIVPPKWSAAVYRTIVTAYLGSRIFRRRGRTPVEVLVCLPSILYHESPRDYRFSRSNRPVNRQPCPSVLLEILQEEGKFEISARRARAEYAASRKENFRFVLRRRGLPSKETNARN